MHIPFLGKGQLCVAYTWNVLFASQFATSKSVVLESSFLGKHVSLCHYQGGDDINIISFRGDCVKIGKLPIMFCISIFLSWYTGLIKRRDGSRAKLFSSDLMNGAHESLKLRIRKPAHARTHRSARSRLKEEHQWIIHPRFLKSLAMISI